MDNQLAVRGGGGGGSVGGDSNASLHSGSGREVEENEDEKIYYGFGVFMGLPLADLKAMKEDFMEQHQSRMVHPVERAPAGNGRGPMIAPPGGRPERVTGDGYERRGEPDAPRLAVPGGGGPRHPATNGFHRRDEGAPQLSYGGADPRCYAQRGQDEREGSDSSDDGQHAKSHSINYILH